MAENEGPQRELTHAPGFPCPQCGLRIRLSLPAFLSVQAIDCPGCGLVMEMDKSQCTRMIELLQDLRNADESVQAMRKQSL